MQLLHAVPAVNSLKIWHSRVGCTKAQLWAHHGIPDGLECSFNPEDLIHLDLLVLVLLVVLEEPVGRGSLGTAP